MHVKPSSSSQAMRICSLLLCLVVVFGETTKRTVMYDDPFRVKALQNGMICCPCVWENVEVDYQSTVDNCCPCAPEQIPKKIPFARRGGASNSDVGTDTSAESCHLITGDVLASPPNCVSYKKNRVDCFYVKNATKTVHQKTLIDGEPKESVDTKGRVRDEVTAVAITSNKFTLIALNQSNYLMTRMIKGGKWREWVTMDDAIAMEMPSTFVRGSGGVTCFYRTLDNALWYVDRSRYGKWEDPKKLQDESMTSPPTCIERGGGDAEDCFVLASNNSVVYQQWLYGEDWTLQPGLGGMGKGRISVVSWSYDRMDIFVLGMENQLMHRALVEEEWEEWEDLGGSFVSAPECIGIDEEAIHCFMVGVDRTLMRKSFDGESWSNWFAISQSLIEKPSCVVTEGTTVACYTRGYTGHMVEIIYKL